MRQARRGDDAELNRIRSDRRQARGDGRHQHVAGPARVLAYHDSATERLEQVTNRASQVVGEGRRQVEIRDATYSIGSEESTHLRGLADRLGGDDADRLAED